MHESLYTLELAKLIVSSDHCIEQFGQCPFQEAYTRQLHSNDSIHEFVPPAIFQTVDEKKYWGLEFPWQTNRSIEHIQGVESIALEQSFDTLYTNCLFGSYTGTLLGGPSVSVDTSRPGYQSVDDSYDLDMLTMPNSKPGYLFSSSFRELADEVSAHNSRFSFCSAHAIAGLQSSFSPYGIDSFHPTDETALDLQSSSNDVSPTPKERWSRQSSSSQPIDHTLENIPVGKIRIDKHPVSRRMQVSSTKKFACTTCSKMFKHEKDLVRH